MEETAQFSESRSSLSSISELCCVHDDELMGDTEGDAFLESDPTVQEKNKKKKKKHKGGLQSPKRILTFNTSELLKLDEHKAEMKKCVAGGIKTLSKCVSFPASAALKVDCPVVENGEGSGDSEDSNEHLMSASPDDKTSMLTRRVSLPGKSALRGGYEELGFGPRPKLCVKWAPSVWEPPCSTISHTLNNTHSKKKDSKHGHKGRSIRNDLHKQNKMKPHKAKCDSGSSTLRRHGASYKDGGGEVESPMQAETSSGASEVLFSSSTRVSKQLGSDTTDIGDINYKLATQKTCCEVADGRPSPSALLKSGAIDGFQYPNDSTCAGSLLGRGSVPCNPLYGQAM